MEADGFVRRRRMTADTAGGDAGVAGASAGAEIRWIGGRLWGVSETLVGSVSPRIGGETTELQTVSLSGGAPEAANPNPEYEGLSQGSPTSTSTHMLEYEGLPSTHTLDYEGLTSTHTLEYEGLPSTHTLDYEGLPQGASTSTHMLAGAVAGIMEHCLMFPIDCVKTRMQSLQPVPAARYRNVMDALRQIITTEGVWRPMRGLNATAVGAGPAHALYFACYEKVKKTLSDAIHPGANSHVANGVAGCVATLLHDAAMNPAEVVKQRMQMYNSPYRGVLDCVGAVWRREGAAAFYRSYPTQLTMNVPFQALHFVTYEYLQELLNPRRQYRPSSHVLSGAAAGAIAAAVTTPLDVCKTLLNTQEGSGAALLPPGRALGARGHIRGLGHAFRTVYRLGGLPGFFKGVTARVIYQTPSTAISWAVYEFFKYGITQRQEERRRRRGRGGVEE